MNLLKKHFLFYHIFQCIPSSNKCNPYDICNKRCSIITKEYYHLSTIVSKNVSINTLTNVTKEIQYCFVLIVEVGGGGGRGGRGGCNKMLSRENCWEFCSNSAK